MCQVRGKAKKTKPLKNSQVRKMIKSYQARIPLDMQYGAGTAFFSRCGPRGGREARACKRSWWSHHTDEDGVDYWLYEELDPVVNF